MTVIELDSYRKPKPKKHSFISVSDPRNRTITFFCRYCPKVTFIDREGWRRIMNGSTSIPFERFPPNWAVCAPVTKEV